MQINGKSVLTLEQFAQVYDQRHPERKPVEKRVSFTRFSIFGVIEMSRKALTLWFIVIAANLMSVGHIVPAMRSFYKLDMPFLVELMGFAGFIAMSFAVIVFMSRAKRGLWAWLVIVMSVTTEAALNVFGSFLAVEAAAERIEIAGIHVTNIAAVIVGLLPAVVNLATGETVRQDMEEERRETEEVERFNATELGKYQTTLERNYINYLRRQGITDETKILEIISGIYEEDFEPIRVDAPEQPQLPPPPVPSPASEPFRGPKEIKFSPRAIELAELMKVDGNERMTNSQIKEHYGISSPNIMSQARKILESAAQGAVA